jgi:hypothetical protein
MFNIAILTALRSSVYVVWHLIVRMRPFRLVMASNLRLFDAIFRAVRLPAGQ